jgi:hypothetical protein
MPALSTRHIEPLLTGSGSGTTVSVGQVSETDLAQPLTAHKTYSVAQVSGTNVAQAITPRKTRTIAQVTGVNTAQVVTSRKTKTLVQTSETDLAQLVTANKRVVLGQPNEADTATATAINPIHRLVGQVVEADTSQTISPTFATTVDVGQVSESDTSQPLTAHKSKATIQVTEADVAQPITPRKLLVLAEATESEIAQPIPPTKSVAIGQASESEIAQAALSHKVRLVGQVIETEDALVVTRPATRYDIALLQVPATTAHLVGDAQLVIGSTTLLAVKRRQTYDVRVSHDQCLVQFTHQALNAQVLDDDQIRLVASTGTDDLWLDSSELTIVS